MRINNISFFNPNFKTNNYKNTLNSNISNLQVKDTFCRSSITSNPINFSGNIPFDKMFSVYSSKLENYVYSSDEITTAGISKIIREFSPNATVKNFSDIKGVLSSQAGACYQATIASADGSTDMPTKILYLNIPEDPSFQDRNVFCEQLLHETIHLMQDEASDRVSASEYISGIFKDDITFESKEILLTALDSTFKKTEEYITSLISSIYIEHDRETLEKYGKDRDSLLEDGLRKILNKKLKKCNLCFKIITPVLSKDDDIFYNYMILNANREKEAYEKSFAKIPHDGRTSKLEERRIMGYRTIIEVAQKLLDESRNRQS